jgi:hypothetical protein
MSDRIDPIYNRSWINPNYEKSMKEAIEKKRSKVRASQERRKSEKAKAISEADKILVARILASMASN